MGGSLIINLLVYMNSVGSLVTHSTDLKTNIWDSPNNTSGDLTVDNDWVYTPGGSPKTNSGYILHTNGWFNRYQCYSLFTLRRFT